MNSYYNENYGLNVEEGKIKLAGFFHDDSIVDLFVRCCSSRRNGNQEELHTYYKLLKESMINAVKGSLTLASRYREYIEINKMIDQILPTIEHRHFSVDENLTGSDKKMKLSAFLSDAKKYDVFLSHANIDKKTYVDALYKVIKMLGIEVFYDKEVISWGDNMKDIIIEGTAKSEFAIIVISTNFFGREWTEKELKGFLSRQNECGQKVILPLLKGITREELIDHYPELGDIQYLDADRMKKEDIVLLLAKELVKRYKSMISLSEEG
ncbi:MAG: toll/interleukin-1 receptor domain-containing protein [Lachnospiraceae bacterium]